jgi:hypothetical protein
LQPAGSGSHVGDNRDNSAAGPREPVQGCRNRCSVGEVLYKTPGENDVGEADELRRRIEKICVDNLALVSGAAQDFLGLLAADRGVVEALDFSVKSPSEVRQPA